MLLNLVSNARDAMEGAGLLEVVLREAGTECLRLTVSDSGPGVALEDRERIFAPFFTRRAAGLGLGLATVSRIVDQAGGQVHIEDSRWGGSSFVVTWPLAERPSAADENAVATSMPMLQATTLVVDDDPLVRETIGDMLTALGHSVIEAPSVADALQALESGSSIDLVLTDLMMPEQTGWQLLDRLRAKNDQRPVVFVSAYDESCSPDSEPVECPNGRLNKPFTLGELQAVVGQVLAEARLSDHRIEPFKDSLGSTGSYDHG